MGFFFFLAIDLLNNNSISFISLFLHKSPRSELLSGWGDRDLARMSRAAFGFCAGEPSGAGGGVVIMIHWYVSQW
jgi:hypothetical protein